MKKIRLAAVPFLLSICLLFSMFPLAVSAAGEESLEDFPNSITDALTLVNGEGEDLSEAQDVSKEAEVRLKYEYSIQDDVDLTPGTPYRVMQIPKEIVTENISDILLNGKDNDNNTILFATVHVDDDGLVTITYTEEGASQSVLKGEFFINTKFDKDEIGNESPVTITFEYPALSVDINFHQEDTTSISKGGVLDGDGNILWTITVTAGDIPLKNAVLTDEIKGQQTYVPGSFVIDPGASGTLTEPAAGNEYTLTYAFPDEIQSTVYTVTYKTTPSTILGVTLKNDAELTYGEPEDLTTLPAHAEVPIVKSLVSKGGAFVKSGSDFVLLDGKYLIKWTVTVNKSEENLTDAVVTDTLPDGLTLVEGDSTYPIEDTSDEAVDGDYTYSGGIFEYSFDDEITKPHTLTFYTTVDDEDYFKKNSGSFRNKATLTSGEIAGGTTSNQAGVGGNTVISKDNKGYDPKTHRIKWQINVNQQSRALEDVVITDDIPLGQTYVEGATISPAGPAGGKFEYAAAEAGDTDKTGTLTYDFGTGSTITQPYTITFYTEVDPDVWANNITGKKYGNTASITVEGIDAGSDGAEQTVNSTVLSKAALDSEYDYVDRVITWKLTVNENETALTNAVVTDPISEGLAFVPDSVRLNGTPVAKGNAAGQYAFADGELTVNLGDISATQVITFQTKITSEKFFVTNGTATVENKAYLSSDDYQNVEAAASASISNRLVGKDADFDDDPDFIDWQVDINANKITLKDVVLTDELPEGLAFDASVPVELYLRTLYPDGSLKLGKQVAYAQSNVAYNAVTRTLTFTLPAAIKDAYLLTFRTTITDKTKSPFTNTIGFKGTGTGSIDTSGSVTVKTQDAGGSASGRTGSITVVKVDGANKPLTGAQFQILYKGAVFRSQTDAAVTDNRTVFSGLKFGRVYYLQETKAPGGYKLDKALYPFMLESGDPATENLTYYFTNSKSGGGDGGNGGGGRDPYDPIVVTPTSSVPPVSSTPVPTEPIGDDDVALASKDGPSSAPGEESIGDDGVGLTGKDVKTGDQPYAAPLLVSLMIAAGALFVVMLRRPAAGKK